MAAVSVKRSIVADQFLFESVANIYMCLFTNKNYAAWYLSPTNGRGKWCNIQIVQISVKSTKFGRGIEANTLSTSGEDVTPKLDTSRFMVIELTILKTTKTQSYS